ncbi:hypothetical protein [Nitratireductor sp. GCM10026969]
MSLYEITTMLEALEKRNEKHKPKEVSDEEWEQAAEMLQSVTANDPNVKI